MHNLLSEEALSISRDEKWLSAAGKARLSVLAENVAILHRNNELGWESSRRNMNDLETLQDKVLKFFEIERD